MFFNGGPISGLKGTITQELIFPPISVHFCCEMLQISVDLVFEGFPDFDASYANIQRFSAYMGSQRVISVHFYGGMRNSKDFRTLTA